MPLGNLPTTQYLSVAVEQADFTIMGCLLLSYQRPTKGFFVMRLFWQQKKTREFLSEAANEVGIADGSSGNFRGTFLDMSFWTSHYLGKSGPDVEDYEPTSFTIGTDSGVQGEFSVLKETLFHRILKRLRIVKEIQTLDRDFDKKYYIKSRTVDTVKPYFGDPEKRKAVDSLFEYGFSELSLKSGTLAVKWKEFHPEDGSVPVTFLSDALNLISPLRN